MAESNLMDVEQCSVDETQLDVPRDDSKENVEGTDLLEVISEHDHALNGSKLKFQIERKKEAQSDTHATQAVAYTLRVDTHVATITSFGASARRNELPIRFEVLEPKNQLIELASDESSTSFCGRFIFAGEAVSLICFCVHSLCLCLCRQIDMCRCMAAVVVRGNGISGQSKAITLCTYQIMLVDVRTRAVDGGTMCDATCSLFAYKKDLRANARKPLNVTLLDDAGYRVPPGPTTWLLARSTSHHQQTHARTIVLTDLDGQASFSLFIARDSLFEISGGFRLHVACDWQTCNELYPSIPTTSRRFECIAAGAHRPVAPTLSIHNALLAPRPSRMQMPLMPLPVVSQAPIHPIPPARPAWQVASTPLPRDAEALLSTTQLSHLGWAPIHKDGVLQCVCCRAVRSDSPLDVITHRPNCTLHHQLKEAAARAASADPRKSAFPTVSHNA